LWRLASGAALSVLALAAVAQKAEEARPASVAKPALTVSTVRPAPAQLPIALAANGSLAD